MIKKSPKSIQNSFPFTSTILKNGLTSLRNRDATWAKIIDSKNYSKSYSTILVMIDDYCDESSREVMLTPDVRCIDGQLYEYQHVKVINVIPTKSDGFLTVNSMTWNKNAPLNDGVHNFHYADYNVNAFGQDNGGYNHLEVKRYKRAYQLKDKAGKVIFNKNDPAPPMLEAADWIRRNYQINAN
jgi:hypothetical protein